MPPTVMPESVRTANEQLEQLNRQIKELVGVYRDAMMDSGRSENEFWIWYTLIAMEGEHAQQDICGMWSLSKQTVNNIITRMVRDGHITLEAVPGTRNRKVIRLTEAGRAFGEDLIVPVVTSELHAFARLTDAERVACMHALCQYTQYLKEELTTSRVSAYTASKEA